MTNASRIAQTTGLVAVLTLSLQACSKHAPPAKPAEASTEMSATPAKSSGTPRPIILVIDRSAIFRGSVVGENIMAQVQVLTNSAESSLKGQDAALRQEAASLQQQLAILSPALKAEKIRAFDAKQAALRSSVQTQQGLIQGGVIKARQQVEEALGPILRDIMTERGANLLLDRNAVVLGTVDVDVTAVAIARLNQKLPSVKVVPTPLPPGVTPQQ